MNQLFWPQFSAQFSERWTSQSQPVKSSLLVTEQPRPQGLPRVASLTLFIRMGMHRGLKQAFLDTPAMEGIEIWRSVGAVLPSSATCSVHVKSPTQNSLRKGFGLGRKCQPASYCCSPMGEPVISSEPVPHSTTQPSLSPKSNGLNGKQAVQEPQSLLVSQSKEAVSWVSLCFLCLAALFQSTAILV